MRISGLDAAQLGLLGGTAAFGQYKLNEARAKRQEAGYASEKTASNNLPAPLMYTHTIDTTATGDVRPTSKPNKPKSSFSQLLRKHPKASLAAGALAAGGLYAAYKRRNTEKTASDKAKYPKE